MPNRFLTFLLSSVFASAAPALTYSTYLRDGFTPNAIATDPAGNIYLAGSTIVDPVSRQTVALVVKLDSKASNYLYVRFLSGSVYDTATAIAVDSSGNAYVAGYTASPDFPVTPGGSFATPATDTTDTRSFVTKLDPAGNVVFSDLLGGSTFNQAQAVGVTAAGQAVVSGNSYSTGFPTTPNAYQVSDSKNRPYLLQVDSAGKVVFSATGIGGSSLVVDGSGNIYMAGSTTKLDYPTTPGAYQTTFPSFMVCFFLCQLSSQGSSQYVTKVDPTGSKLIYSTALTGGETMNAGLAIDSTGNAYVTGFAWVGSYPYTVTLPSVPNSPVGIGGANGLPFLSKLDPTGQKLLFSVPVGGAGVQVDSAGSVYVGGRIGYAPSPALPMVVTSPLPALASVPAQCLPNNVRIRTSAYASQVSAASGDLLGTQFIGGSNIGVSGVALAGSSLWLAGPTPKDDVPFTPNALLTDVNSSAVGNPGAGAYLGAVDFSQPSLPVVATPQIGCVLDVADFAPSGPVTRLQLLSIFGTLLGPAMGVSAPDNSTTSLAGVSVYFGNVPATLLYVSSTQINFAVPNLPFNQSAAAFTVSLNGATSTPRLFPITGADPHFFMNISETYNTTVNPNLFSILFSLNGDGTVSTFANPAQAGSTVSIFVNGVEPNPNVTSAPLEFLANNGWSVEKITQASPFVARVDLQAPSVFCGTVPLACPTSLELFYTDGTKAGSGGWVYIKGRSSP